MLTQILTQTELIMKVMKKMVLVILTAGLGFAAHAADKVTIQLKWVTQAQFAGCLLYTSPSPRDA